ncbi:MAG: DUF411 domain-containing protein [Geminicoccaceae bacterium]|nr:DUF411 domain-containing protein [Geminicoccaceae bacterium]MDW8342431.1 DUF411 domain-containing protein [Geminicoccaceae bacterium]
MSLVALPRRRLLLALAGAALAAPGAVRAASGAIEIWKLRGCGCCDLWARHLEAEGFATRLREVTDLAPVRARLGVPPALAGCHSARLADLSIEGHVPALAIRRLLADRPPWVAGLAVPGMPEGSPGMPSPEPEVYEVFVFGRGGRVEPFLRFRGETPL